MRVNLLLFYIFLTVIFSSCSTGKKISIRQMYHNTTAKYNAFYLGNSKLLELENEIIKTHQEDYSQTLPIFYSIDSSTIEANKSKILEIKEMASKSIEWHKTSKWVDDSYFLLGMADYYSADFDDALNTFKFLNVNSNDKNIRHKSLAQLLRIFVDLKKYEDAAFVIDYLSKENKISNINKLNIYKSLAYFYANRRDINGHIGAIDQATKYTKNKKELSRLHFMLAQLYQNEGQDALAYDYYKKALKGNPPYERSFFAQLYAQKVAVLNQTKDGKKVRDYYASLYKDAKNKDLKDVILFEQALFELKQNNVDEAENLLIKASQESGAKSVQKGYIFEKLAYLSIETKKDYRTAKFRVDSALMFFKPNDLQFLNLSKLKPPLDNYVKHFDLIQKNDSLIYLSSLNPQDQLILLNKFIENEEEKIKIAQSKQSNKKNIIPFDNLLAFSGSSKDQAFYFQNPNTIQQGGNDFIRIWGNRPLTDNWRRSSQSFSVSSSPLNNKREENLIPSKEDNEITTNPINQIPKLESLLAAIPQNQAEIDVLKSSLEEANFELGKLLLLELKEKEMSIGYLENLITNYPNTPKKPEALYLLYLAHSESKFNQDLYIRLLNSQFPQSPFTYYVNNPKGESGNIAYLASSKSYKEAYELYEKKSYEEALEIIKKSLEQYPLTKNTDKFLLLEAMIIAKTESVDNYVSLLNDFIKQTENQELKVLAENMLNQVKGNSEDAKSQVEDKQETLAIEITNKAIESEVENDLIESPYKENPNQTHIFVIPLKTQDAQSNKALLSDLEAFHIANFSSSRLRTGNMNLNQEYTIFLISPFNNQEKAKDYRQKFMEGLNTSSLTQEEKNQVFIISIENFQELNRRKNLEEYRTFYLKNY
jgi:outer membrane protein assembly factor BamD (BamD/ComL family)